MASEDWFLRLDPYNFDTEEDYLKLNYPELFREKEEKDAQHNQD